MVDYSGSQFGQILRFCFILLTVLWFATVCGDFAKGMQRLRRRKRRNKRVRAAGNSPD